MAKNIKTVRRRFDYRQGDDFAAYLNYMARQGWHFKEFRSGLVFEKGEPEDAVYAVEVFTDGTAHDMQPSFKAMNFGEYCEAAGWQLIDQRVKWCVLKRIREDAVPIFTDEERFENVKSVTYARQGNILWFKLLFTAFILWVLVAHPKTYLFSSIRMTVAAFFLINDLLEIYQAVEFRLWCKRCREQLERGEALHFRHPHNLVLQIAMSTLSFLIFLIYASQTFDVQPVVFLIYLALSFLIGSLPGRFRMDADTSKLTSALSFSFTLLFLITIIVVSSYHDMRKPEPEPPVSISVFHPDETVKDVELSHSESPFGSKLSCYLYTEENQVKYFIYESRFQWVLDAVWKEEVRKSAQISEDCTDIWDAVEAIRKDSGKYVVRYEDRILLLLPGPEPLTQEQIEAVIAALREG